MKYFFIATLLIALITPTSQGNIITDKLLEGVEKLINKEVTKTEEKIDTFVRQEVQKVKHELMVLYIVMILISMVYSTILMFAARKFLSKE